MSCPCRHASARTESSLGKTTPCQAGQSWKASAAQQRACGDLAGRSARAIVRAKLKARPSARCAKMARKGVEARSHNRPGARDAWIWERRTTASREIFGRGVGSCASAAGPGRAETPRNARSPPTARTRTTNNANTFASFKNLRTLFPICSCCASDSSDRTGARTYGPPSSSACTALDVEKPQAGHRPALQPVGSREGR